MKNKKLLRKILLKPTFLFLTIAIFNLTFIPQGFSYLISNNETKINVKKVIFEGKYIVVNNSIKLFVPSTFLLHRIHKCKKTNKLKKCFIIIDPSKKILESIILTNSKQ